jgi:alpha-tubulin suppressor-like RCC1 family protein
MLRVNGGRRQFFVAIAGLCAMMVLLGTAGASAAVKRWGSYDAFKGLESTPTEITNLSEVVAVDASNSSTYALESHGTVWAVGENSAGELGDEQTAPSPIEAQQVRFPPAVTIKAIGEAEDSGFAIDTTGQGWTWGETLCLGAGGNHHFAAPQKVPEITDARAVQGAGHHVLWLLEDGTVEACGANNAGQLGVGPGISKSASPVAVPGLSNVVEVSAGERSSCALTGTGTVYDWGSDRGGQVGNGAFEEAVYSPFEVPLPGPASELSCGGDLRIDGHTLALVGGEVVGWGTDRSDQIGDCAGQSVCADKPTPTSTGLHFSEVVAGGADSFGLTAAHELYGWGNNRGRGLGVPGVTLFAPTLIESGIQMISATSKNTVDG